MGAEIVQRINQTCGPIDYAFVIWYSKCEKGRQA